jgi:outer membrane lipoprotein-sorting protein
MNELQDSILDEQVRKALGTPSAADFDAWRNRHGDAIAYLNPVVTAMYEHRRRTLIGIASTAVAAAILVGVGSWLLVPREPAFAQAVQTIKKAVTVSWTITWYNRMTSEDGKRTWLRKLPRWERAWMAPSRYRDTKYDEDGNIATVDIEDLGTGTVLHLDMKKKTAMLENKSVQPVPSGYQTNPFVGIAKTLESEPIEFVGQRDINGVQVNAFRHHKEFPQGASENMEIWLDAKSKQLVGYSTASWFVGYHGSKNDFFDPASAPDRNNPAEQKFKKGQIAGTITGDIVFDAQLDPELFSMTPPDGFTIVEPKPRPKVTEAQLIEWLRVTALANDGKFVETTLGLDRERQVAIFDKPRADRSKAEQEYEALAQKHVLDGNVFPITEFANESTEPRSFRYLGKGVKLGSGERVVCAYKLKGTAKYRAVFGDLTVKDVDPNNLPIPVEE